jgi:hypothetical protein
MRAAHLSQWFAAPSLPWRFSGTVNLDDGAHHDHDDDDDDHHFDYRNPRILRADIIRSSGGSDWGGLVSVFRKPAALVIVANTFCSMEEKSRAKWHSRQVSTYSLSLGTVSRPVKTPKRRKRTRLT